MRLVLKRPLRRGDILTGLGVFAVAVSAPVIFVGWVMNIAAIWGAPSVTGSVLLRIIGVPVWPLGAILGWLTR